MFNVTIRGGDGFYCQGEENNLHPILSFLRDPALVGSMAFLGGGVALISYFENRRITGETRKSELRASRSLAYFEQTRVMTELLASYAYRLERCHSDYKMLLENPEHKYNGLNFVPEDDIKNQYKTNLNLSKSSNSRFAAICDVLSEGFNLLNQVGKLLEINSLSPRPFLVPFQYSPENELIVEKLELAKDLKVEAESLFHDYLLASNKDIAKLSPRTPLKSRFREFREKRRIRTKLVQIKNRNV